jgi:hypothetical protein
VTTVVFINEPNYPRPQACLDEYTVIVPFSSLQQKSQLRWFPNPNHILKKVHNTNVTFVLKEDGGGPCHKWARKLRVIVTPFLHAKSVKVVCMEKHAGPIDIELLLKLRIKALKKERERYETTLAKTNRSIVSYSEPIPYNIWMDFTDTLSQQHPVHPPMTSIPYYF